MITKVSQLGVIDNSQWTSPITRDSLTIPRTIGQSDSQRNALKDYWNMRYKYYCWSTIFWCWNGSASDHNPTRQCATVTRMPPDPWARLRPCLHSHFIPDNNHTTSIRTWTNTLLIHTLVCSFSHSSVEDQYWSEMILFMHSELSSNMAFHTTIALVTEETTHLQPIPINLPSGSREKDRSTPVVVPK
jgi:hypothetical protein